jgi:hypothetical protein
MSDPLKSERIGLLNPKELGWKVTGMKNAAGAGMDFYLIQHSSKHAGCCRTPGISPGINRGNSSVFSINTKHIVPEGGDRHRGNAIAILASFL